MKRNTLLFLLAWVVAIVAGSACLASLPAPNHPLFFGYWHVASPADGQRFNCDDYYSFEPTVWWADANGNWGYKTIINHDQLYPIPRGSFDYWAETLSWTNGYVSESRDTSDLNPDGGQDPHLIWEALWVARQVETMERAAIAGKDIYWEVRMPFLGITGALPKIIVAIRDHDVAHPEAQIWPRVKWIDVADTPGWDASNIGGHCTTMINKLAQYGLPTTGKLFGITVDDAGFAAAKASTADFVDINAYLDAPATNQQGDTQQWANALDAKLASYISQLTSAGKKTFLRLQGFDGGGCWHDMNTVAELQRVAYRRAATNTNVLGLTIWNWAGGGSTNAGDLCPSGEMPAAFAWGSRPNGPRDQAPSMRPEFRAVHQEIYLAITGGQPPAGPGPVTSFVASAGSGQVNLSWHNPSDASFTGTMIRYKTSGYPTGETDGVLLVDKSASTNTNDSYLHTGLTNGTTYYYAAFSHDGVPNHASPANVYATPIGTGYCFQELIPYSNGNLSGLGGWTGSSSSSISVADGTVKMTAGATEYTCAHLLSCIGGTSGIIQFKMQIQSGSGLGGFMWSVWIDDPTAKNLARWYGSYNSVIGRIGGTSTITSGRTLTGAWDNLEVRINTTTNMSEFFFNGSSMGSLSHAVTGAGDTAGSVWFQRWDRGDLAGSTLYFDNMTVGPYDGTPPAGVTSFSVIAGNGQMNLSWVNPPDGDFTGTMIRYKTTGYPTSTTDGTLLLDKTGSPSATVGCVHNGATNGVTYYYSAFAHDSIPNYSPPAQATGTPAYFDAYDAKTTNDAQTVVLTAGVVSADFANFFYVQTPYGAPSTLSLSKGLAAIRVDRVGHGVTAGHTVGVRGALLTDPSNGERAINADWVKSYGDAAVEKIGMGARSLGGADWIDGPRITQAGIFEPYGPNNVGLLVRVWGKVTQIDTSGGQYFYVDDGSGLLDGTSTLGVANTGVRVKYSPSGLNAGDFVVVTGISTMFKDASGKLRRQVLPLAVGGVQKLAP